MSQINEENLSDWGDQENWNAFYKQYNDYLRALAVSYKLPSQDVDDVVQEVFISMANFFKEKKFDSKKGHIHSWVTTFAKWRMIDIVRRNQRINKQVTSGDDLLMEMQPDERQNADSFYENKRQKSLFRRAVKNVAKQHLNKDFLIFSDFHFNNLSNEQIMQKHRVNSSMIYIAKHRVIKRIKNEVQNILCTEPNY